MPMFPKKGMLSTGITHGSCVRLPFTRTEQSHALQDAKQSGRSLIATSYGPAEALTVSTSAVSGGLGLPSGTGNVMLPVSLDTRSFVSSTSSRSNCPLVAPPVVPETTRPRSASRADVLGVRADHEPAARWTTTGSELERGCTNHEDDLKGMVSRIGKKGNLPPLVFFLFYRPKKKGDSCVLTFGHGPPTEPPTGQHHGTRIKKKATS